MTVSIASAAATTEPRRHGGLLRRVAGYAVSRGATEALLAVRSVLLAALLGPAAFGSWALFRLGTRYSGLAGLGVFRGLELELLQGDARAKSDHEAPAATALGFVLLVGGILSLLALGAALLVQNSEYRVLLVGFAVASLAELLYGYALVCTRIRSGLRRFAILETSTAALNLVLAVALARIWGLAGAFAGVAGWTSNGTPSASAAS